MEDKWVQDSLYKCVECAAIFTYKHTLLKHMMEHSGSFACDKCPANFSHEGSLKTHLLSSHLEMRPYSCPDCKVSFALNQSLLSHMKYHQGGSCSKAKNIKEPSPAFVPQAPVIEEPEPPQIIPVPETSLQTGLIINPGYSAYKIYAFDPNQSNAVNEIQAFKCQICLQDFLGDYDLNEHLKTHLPVEINPENVEKTTENHEGVKPFYCGTCGAPFFEIFALSEHELTHQTENENQIDYPGYSNGETGSEPVLSEYATIEHLRRQWEDDVNPEQPVSGETVSVKSVLDEPVKKKVSREIKTHLCVICDKSFARKDGLIRHQKQKHSGETRKKSPRLNRNIQDKFECMKCADWFANEDLLKRHQSMAHGGKVQKEEETSGLQKCQVVLERISPKEKAEPVLATRTRLFKPTT